MARCGEAAIVSETSVVGANVSAIARQHGLTQSLINLWRKLFAAIDAEPAFAIFSEPPSIEITAG